MNGPARVLLAIGAVTATFAVIAPAVPIAAAPIARYSASRCPAGVPADPRVSCGRLVVPEDRAHPDGRQVTLPVARIRSSRSLWHRRSDPVVYLEGGPGYPGLQRVQRFL